MLYWKRKVNISNYVYYRSESYDTLLQYYNNYYRKWEDNIVTMTQKKEFLGNTIQEVSKEEVDNYIVMQELQA